MNSQKGRKLLSSASLAVPAKGKHTFPIIELSSFFCILIKMFAHLLPISNFLDHCYSFLSVHSEAEKTVSAAAAGVVWIEKKYPE